MDSIEIRSYRNPQVFANSEMGKKRRKPTLPEIEI